MAIPLWPETLPEWARDGYSSKAEPSLIKTEMNSSVVRQRRRFSQTVHVKSVALVMNADQHATFYAFWRDALGHGASMFSAPVWNGSMYVTRICQMVDGQYTEEQFAPAAVRVAFQVRVVGL